MSGIEEYVQTPINAVKEKLQTGVDNISQKVNKTKKGIVKSILSTIKVCWENTKAAVVSTAISAAKSSVAAVGTMAGLVGCQSLVSSLNIAGNNPYLYPLVRDYFSGTLTALPYNLYIPTGVIADTLLLGGLGMSAASFVPGIVRGYRKYKLKTKEKELNQLNHRVACMDKCLENNPNYKFAKERLQAELQEKKEKKNNEILEAKIDEKINDVAKDQGPGLLSIIPVVGNTLDYTWKLIKKTPIKPIINAVSKVLGTAYKYTLGFVWNFSFSPKNYKEDKARQEKKEMQLSEMEKMQNAFMATLTKEEQGKVIEAYQKELANEKKEPLKDVCEVSQSEIEDIKDLREVAEERSKQEASAETISLDIQAIDQLAQQHENKEMLEFLDKRFPKDQEGVRQNVTQITEADVKSIHQIAFRSKMNNVLKLLPKGVSKKKKSNAKSVNIAQLSQQKGRV